MVGDSPHSRQRVALEVSTKQDQRGESCRWTIELSDTRQNDERDRRVRNVGHDHGDRSENVRLHAIPEAGEWLGVQHSSGKDERVELEQNLV